MAQLDTTKELDFLIHESEQNSSHLLAQAMQEGIHILFKRHVAEAYVGNRIDRDQALQMLGAEEIAAIEYAWQAVEKDIAWGMNNG
jgi:hypothetical protein